MERNTRFDGRLTLACYKRLILMGKIRLPLEQARRIVGPDCAYHLYFGLARQGARTGGVEAGARPRRRRVDRRHK